MNLIHPIIERVPEDFLLFIEKAEYNLAKFLKWNNFIHPETGNKNEIIQISDSELESDFSNDEIHRRKKRKKRKKKKKLFPSQLIRLIARLRRIDPELIKLKKVDFSWNKSWKNNLDSMINIEISEDSKEELAEKHQKMISKFQKDQYDDRIIIYTDKSKSEINQIGAGLIYTTNFSCYQWKAWNLGLKYKVFNAELFAIKKAIDFTYKKTDIWTREIWI